MFIDKMSTMTYSFYPLEPSDWYIFHRVTVSFYLAEQLPGAHAPAVKILDDESFQAHQTSSNANLKRSS